jgi:PST family polysaccharide transporter
VNPPARAVAGGEIASAASAEPDTPSLRARLLRSRVARNAGALYGVQLAGFVLPLLTIPYLARVLGVNGWGQVLFAQSFAAWLTLVVEYGFTLSATRAVAQAPRDGGRVACIVAGVVSAKLVLSLVAAAVVGVAALSVPAFRANPQYLLWAGLVAVVQGLSPLWYFQGVERMRAAAAAEVLARVAAALGVFVWVRAPEDGWRVLALQATTAAVWVAFTTWVMLRETGPVRPGPRAAARALREGAPLFFFRGASGVYTSSNAFLLGLFAAPQVVGYFGGADRIVRALVSLLLPVSQALYPRASYLASTDEARANRLVRSSVYAVAGLALAGAVGVAVLAPQVVRTLLGPEYLPAVPIFRGLVFVVPLIALGTVMGMQWALPRGHDRILYTLVGGAAVLNVAGTLLFAPRFGAAGMTGAILAAEAFVALGLLSFSMRMDGGALWRGALGSLRSRAVRS